VSEETLRDWEKQLQDDDLLVFKWQAASLAGYLQENPEVNTDEIEVRYLGNRSTLWHARIFSERKQSLEYIREQLKKHHSQVGG
jgi:hypothetical protein